MLFKMVHWILTLQPEAPAELSLRATLSESMGNPALAIKDWERYIANINDPESVAEIRARIDHLKKTAFVNSLTYKTSFTNKGVLPPTVPMLS
jgi:regulator of sirC expression with transglutaminase-like and TPR domain